MCHRQVLQLGGEYYLVTNYTYFKSLYTATQYSTLFNVLHVYAQKKISVTRRFNWYLEGHLQQATGNPPVNLPLVLARSRFAFEGNFFKNLFLSQVLKFVIIRLIQLMVFTAERPVNNRRIQLRFLTFRILRCTLIFV